MDLLRAIKVQSMGPQFGPLPSFSLSRWPLLVFCLKLVNSGSRLRVRKSTAALALKSPRPVMGLGTEG